MIYFPSFRQLHTPAHEAQW